MRRKTIIIGGLLFFLFGCGITKGTQKNTCSTLGISEADVIVNLSDQSLEIFPQCILDLPSLRSLNISSNSIKKIPDDFDKLTLLGFFECERNQIDHLPESIINMTNLVNLKVNENRIKSLPKNFSNLSKLNSLNINDNEIVNLPDDIFSMESLEEILAYGNPIESLPECKTKNVKLFWVACSDGKIKSIPKSIYMLEQLEYLNLKNNQITTIPDELGQLKNLKTLILTGNPISAEEKERIMKLLPNTEIRI